MTVQSTEKFEEGQDVRVAGPLRSPGAPEQPSPAPTPKGLNRLFQSAVILLAVLLLSGYALVCRFYPWRDLANQDIPEWIISFAGDCADYCLVGKKSKVLVVGTSLISAVNHRLSQTHLSLSQSALQHKVVPGQALALEVSLNSQLPHQAEKETLSMAAVPGSMMTDQLLILENIIEHEKKPELLVLTVAPRDFIDNENKSARNSPVARVFFFLSRNQNYLPRSLSPADIGSCLEGHKTFIELLRTDILRKVKKETCRITGHPDSLWTATNTDFRKDLKEQKTAETKKSGEKIDLATLPEFGRKNIASSLAEDLKLYGKRYMPFNQERMEKQLNAYDQLLQKAKSEDIRVLVLFMPVSKPNSALLPPAVLSRLKSQVFARAKAGGVNAYDLEQEVIKVSGSPLVLDDFVDSVHVNKAGAEKLIGPLSNLMAQEVKALATAH